MKIIFICLAFALGGCTTTAISTGGEFSTYNVDLIVKGETTAEEMVKLFGQPFQKAVITTNQEKWIYMEITSKARGSIFTGFSSDTRQKMLDVLLTDDIVVNFAFSEKDTGYHINTQL